MLQLMVGLLQSAVSVVSAIKIFFFLIILSSLAKNKRIPMHTTHACLRQVYKHMCTWALTSRKLYRGNHLLGNQALYFFHSIEESVS